MSTKDADKQSSTDTPTARHDVTGWKDEETLSYLVLEKGYNNTEAGRILGCSNTTVKNWIDEHELDGAKPHECPLCDYCSRTRPDLGGHMSSEHGMLLREYERQNREGEFDCDECKAVFETERGLNIHITKNHTEEMPWRDRDILRELYIGEELSMVAVAETLGCSVDAVRTWLKKHEIPIRGRFELRERPWRDEDILRELYIDKALPLTQVAEDLDCSRDAVTDGLNHHGIPIRSKAETARLNWPPELRERNQLYGLYTEQELSTRAIAEQVGVSQTMVTSALDHHNIDTRNRTPLEYDELYNETVLREMYVGQGLTIEEINQIVGCSTPTTLQWLREHEVETRSRGLSGEAHPNWLGGHRGYRGPRWGEQRKAALERDGYKCVSCGTSAKEQYARYRTGLTAHHRVRFESFAPFDGPEDYAYANRKENLVTLCSHCHPIWDSLPVQIDVRAV